MEAWTDVDRIAFTHLLNLIFFFFFFKRIQYVVLGLPTSSLISGARVTTLGLELLVPMRTACATGSPRTGRFVPPWLVGGRVPLRMLAGSGMRLPGR
jgi:hypothetical protein